MEMVLFLLLFATFGLAAYAVLRALGGTERQMARRLRGVNDYVAPEREIKVAPTEAEPVRGEPLADKVMRRAFLLTRDRWSSEYRDRVRAKLARAGKPWGSSDVDRMLASKVVFAMAGAACMAVVALAAQLSVGMGVFLVAGAAMGGFLLPDSRLDEAIKARRKTIIRELPDVLDMLTISVTAGLGFDQALAKLAGTSKGEVVVEFERVTKEVNAGASRKQALKAMAQRVDMPEMASFVAAVSQAESFGTPIATVLRTQADELRLRRRQAAEEEAQKAPVKMTIPLMLVILPATILLLLGPALESLLSVFG